MEVSILVRGADTWKFRFAFDPGFKFAFQLWPHLGLAQILSAFERPLNRDPGYATGNRSMCLAFGMRLTNELRQFIQRWLALALGKRRCEFFAEPFPARATP